MAACAVVVTAGCTRTMVNTVEPASSTAQPQMLSDQRVLTDQTLNNKVRIIGLNTWTGPQGFLKIQASVQNRTRKVASFTYRVEWFDENGIIIETPSSPATPRSIEARQTVYVTATAPTTRARDFRISFLEPTTK